jgi:hypothetical protein
MNATNKRYLVFLRSESFFMTSLYSPEKHQSRRLLKRSTPLFFRQMTHVASTAEKSLGQSQGFRTHLIPRFVTTVSTAVVTVSRFPKSYTQCHFPQIPGMSSSTNELNTLPYSKYIWPFIPQIFGLSVLITINIRAAQHFLFIMRMGIEQR